MPTSLPRASASLILAALVSFGAVACTATEYVTKGADSSPTDPATSGPEDEMPPADEDVDGPTDGDDGGTANPPKKDGGTTPPKDGGAPPPPKDGGPPPPPPPPPVGGATVAQCQGTSSIVADFGGTKPVLKTGFAIYTQGHYEVYLYSRPLIDDYAYGGTAGEFKARLIIGGPTGTPNQYQGMFGVFRWDVAQAKWSNLATPTDVTLVDITNYQVVDPTGLMCNGRLRGGIQALFSSSNPVVAAFDVPILTVSFPKTNPGPP